MSHELQPFYARRLRLGDYNVFLIVSFCRTGMAGVPGTASAIFAAVKDVGANVIMISQVHSPSIAVSPLNFP